MGIGNPVLPVWYLSIDKKAAGTQYRDIQFKSVYFASAWRLSVNEKQGFTDFP
jgi:hypothetical protein